MSYRTRNRRRAIRESMVDRAIARAGTDKGVSERLAQTFRARPLQHLADQLDNDGPRPGAINAYYCPDCRRPTVTVHRDRGVTPMFLGCRVTDGCHGRATSTGYRLDPAKLPPATHEWYRPDDLRGLEPAMRDHVERGGLVLREVAQ